MTTKNIIVSISEKQIDAIDNYIQNSLMFNNRSEFIRHAVFEYIKKNPVDKGGK
jgi:metal-responsive CopG/Arc/MetJ family transcriptional regulator